MTPRFLPCGDAALSVEFGEEIDRDLSRRILAIKAAVDEAGLEGVVETVPSYRALLVHYDPLRTGSRRLVGELEPLLDGARRTSVADRTWRLPCCYDEEYAPDLPFVSEFTGIPPERIVELHAATIHYVYMLGFAPGQPYLGDLPPELAVPRRDNPVPRIERGSVVTATGLTVVYPIANATGWHVIGRTPVRLFDPFGDPPVLLAPGDTVVFEPVDAGTFREMEAAGHTVHPSTGEALR